MYVHRNYVVVYFRGLCIAFILFLRLVVTRYSLAMTVVLINVAVETELSGTRKNCWTFTMQKLSWRFDLCLNVTVPSPHTPLHNEHVHVSATSTPQEKTMKKRATINTSPVMVPTTIPAMAPGDTPGWALGRERGISDYTIYPAKFLTNMNTALCDSNNA